MPTCQSGYTCLKDWYDTSRTTTADAMCGAYSGGVRERASTIIYKVAQACGINPQVLLVMLQKEQGLVTHTWPSDWRYTIAMGQGCPDTAACDTRYYGFFNQVYGAAWQLKRYANPPGTSQYFTWYAPGQDLEHPLAPERGVRQRRRSTSRTRRPRTSTTTRRTSRMPRRCAPATARATGARPTATATSIKYFTDWFGSDPARSRLGDRVGVPGSRRRGGARSASVRRDELSAERRRFRAAPTIGGLDLLVCSDRAPRPYGSVRCATTTSAATVPRATWAGRL